MNESSSNPTQVQGEAVTRNIYNFNEGEQGRALKMGAGVYTDNVKQEKSLWPQRTLEPTGKWDVRAGQRKAQQSGFVFSEMEGILACVSERLC